MTWENQEGAVPAHGNRFTFATLFPEVRRARGPSNLPTGCKVRAGCEHASRKGAARPLCTRPRRANDAPAVERGDFRPDRQLARVHRQSGFPRAKKYHHGTPLIIGITAALTPSRRRYLRDHGSQLMCFRAQKDYVLYAEFRLIAGNDPLVHGTGKLGQPKSLRAQTI